jgi:hypothetical protein
MSIQQEVRGILRLRGVQLMAMIALLVGVGTECFITKLSVLDLDVWWHLSVGDWILRHHAFPHSGILSRTAADRPWMAYSWGYEILLARSYDLFGFVGMALFGTAVTMAVAVAVFWMLHRISGRFWRAWTLTVIALSAFLFNIMPRPVFFSMALFALTLTLIFKALNTGRLRLLCWLPLIFVLWANSHIQFVYGLFAVGLLAGVTLLQRMAQQLDIHPDVLREPTLPSAPLFLIFGLCMFATCLGPYSYHLYGLLPAYSSSKVFYAMIVEMQALSFQGVTHFLELLLAAAAFYAIGWRQKLDLFKFLLLIAASVLAFRMTRDAWFLCITAAAVLADSAVPEDQRNASLNLSEWAGVAIASVLLLFLAARNTDFNPRGLDRAISNQFPVDAVNFLRQHPVPGPLYNNFDWGGFLIFYLPDYPVSIDGRADLYGDALCGRIYATESASPSYLEDPDLNEAGLVILKNTVPLARLLPTDQRFRVVYHDEIATVLARN